MNVTFTLLQGTGDGQEMRLDIYNPAHGVGGAHKEPKKTAFRIKRNQASGDTLDDRKFADGSAPVSSGSGTETLVLMTKQEARAVASALMGAASEL
jgi:hypothetical protein